MRVFCDTSPPTIAETTSTFSDLTSSRLRGPDAGTCDTTTPAATAGSTGSVA
jgi:hypothetical protein